MKYKITDETIPRVSYRRDSFKVTLRHLLIADKNTIENA